MTWVWGSSMGQKQGDHATKRAGTNISVVGAWVLVAAYSYHFVESLSGARSERVTRGVLR